MDLIAGHDFSALELSPNAYVILTPDLRVLWVNAAYLSLVGLSRVQVIGAGILDLYPKDPHAPERTSSTYFQRALQNALERKRPTRIPYVQYAMRDSVDPGRFVERYWTGTYAPVFGEDGRLAFILKHLVDVTGLRTLGLSYPASTESFANLTGEVLHTAEALQSRLDRFRRMFDQAPGLIAVRSGPEHVYEFVNERYRIALGRPEPVIGLPVRQVLAAEMSQAVLERLDKVYADGQPFIGRNEAMPWRDTPDGPLTERRFDMLYNPIFNADGSLYGILFIGQDLTEIYESEARQQRLARELQHRTKNLLATVTAISAQTRRTSRTPTEFHSAFEGRLIALSKTHDALVRSTCGVLVEDILRLELAPYDRDAFSMDGPPLRTTGRTATALGMAVHELATNAAKYGALSVPDGKVSIAFSERRVADAVLLEFSWTERGGPPVRPPVRRGFGLELLERISAGADRVMTFAPEGLQCRFSLRPERS